ncbi:hypothetical protein IT568_05900 [bacterium]|nr:hypothetical protein [bacterium]
MRKLILCLFVLAFYNLANAQSSSGFRVTGTFSPTKIDFLNNSLETWSKDVNFGNSSKITKTESTWQIGAEILNEIHENLVVGGGFGFIKADEGKFSFANTYTNDGNKGTGNYTYLTQAVPLAVNAYTYYTFGFFTGYFGAGLNYCFIWGFEDFNFELENYGKLSVNTNYSGGAFGLNTQAGMTFQVTDAFALDLGVKYNLLQAVKLDGKPKVNGFDDSGISDDNYTKVKNTFTVSRKTEVDLSGIGFMIGVSMSSGKR